MAKLSDAERVKILIMISYGDRQRSHHDIHVWFNNVHPDRNPTVKSWKP